MMASPSMRRVGNFLYRLFPCHPQTQHMGGVAFSLCAIAPSAVLTGQGLSFFLSPQQKCPGESSGAYEFAACEVMK